MQLLHPASSVDHMTESTTNDSSDVMQPHSLLNSAVTEAAFKDVQL